MDIGTIVGGGIYDAPQKTAACREDSRVPFPAFPANFAPDFSQIPDGSTVLVGFSGGADSLSLLAAVCGLREAKKLTVHACHVHHGLRGDEADADAAFCDDLCKQLGVPCRVVRLSLRDSSEESARRGRYAALTEAAHGVGAAYLLLAHNADDNLETALLNLSRGTGSAGLGMPPSRVIDGVRVLRPLLGVPRAAIEAYVSACGFEPRTDRTNLADDYARNRLRHQALPAMVSVNPRAVENAARALSHLREDEEFLASLADELLEKAAVSGGWDVRVLRSAPKPVLVRALIRLFAAQDLSARHIDALMGLLESAEGTKSLDLPGKRAVNAYGVLSMEGAAHREVSSREVSSREVSSRGGTVSGAGVFPLPVGESFVLPGSHWRVHTKRLQMQPDDRQTFHNFYVDSSAIHGILSVGTRRPGDSFVPWKREHAVSLKKFMIERRILAGERDSIPVIRDDEGIVGVPGIGIAARCAAAPGCDAIVIEFERI